MQANIVKLKFLAPLHLGSREGMLESTLSHIPSDVLFAALCTVYSNLYGRRELEELLAAHHQQPCLLISSAFPYYQDRLFLPRPVNLDLTDYGFEPKKARRVKYITYELFCLALSGQLKARHLESYQEEAVGGVLLPAGCRAGKIWHEDQIPRVALDSLTGASSIYYFNQITFHPAGGLYCLVQCREQLWPRLKTCFRVLGDEGIGGDRSAGKGGFQVEFAGSLTFPVVEQPGSYVLLSLYYPAPGEARALKADYTLLKRSGYIYSPQENAVRKKSLFMLGEGSVVYTSPPGGMLVDITPPGFTAHQVWRHGYALWAAAAAGEGRYVAATNRPTNNDKT